MKILMLTESLGEGGAETHIVTLASSLAGRGHDVTVASAGGVYANELLERGVTHKEIKFTSRSPIAILNAEREIESLIRSGGFSVLHAHTRYTAALATPICKKLDVPLVTTAHWVFELSQPKKMLTRWGERTLAVSDDIRDYLCKNYRIPQGNITVTVNGIDTQKFAPAKVYGRGGSFHIVHVSRIDRGRAECAFALVRAAQRIAELIPNARITIIGGGNMLEALIREALEKNKEIGREFITLTGARADIAPRLVEADVFVGVSRAALEAMACEIPVILCGDEGYGGILYPRCLSHAAETNFCCRGDGKVEEARLIRDILTVSRMSHEERRALGSAMRRVILDGYSDTRMAEDAEGVYYSIAGDTPKKKVLVCGYIGAGNAGDELMLTSLLRRLHEDGGYSVCAVSASPRDTSRLHCIESLRKTDIRAITARMRECDSFILGGGNLLQNKTSNRSLLYYATLFRMAKRCGCATYLYSSGIGELDGDRARVMAREVLRACDGVYLRTRADAERAREMAGDLAMLARFPDASLSICTPASARDGTFSVSVIDAAEKFGLSRDEYAMRMAKIIGRLSEACGLKAKIIVMHAHEDLDISCEIAVRVAGARILRDASPLELIREVSLSHFSLSQRLHHAYISLGSEVPVAHFSMDEKSRDMAADVRENDGFFRLLACDLYADGLIDSIAALSLYDGTGLQKFAVGACEMARTGLTKLTQDLAGETKKGKRA